MQYAITDRVAIMGMINNSRKYFMFLMPKKVKFDRLSLELAF
jgi:hypothetical protein